MVHVPVQDGRRLDLLKMRHFQPQRPRCQIQFTRQRHHRPQRRAAHRNRMPPPQRPQIHVASMIPGNHGKARQAAFGGLRLPDIRKPRTTPWA